MAHLCNLTDQALERQLADQQLRGLLVLADLAQRDSAGPVAVGLLHTACGNKLHVLQCSVADS